MPGAKIPVMEIEKLTITDDGRGINLYWDGTNYFSGNITGPWASGAIGTKSGQFLPAASTMGWATLDMMSGSTGTTFTGYVPVFKYKW